MACSLAAKFSPYRVSFHSLAKGMGEEKKREREREDEGSDLREKLMFSLESRLSVG